MQQIQSNCISLLLKRLVALTVLYKGHIKLMTLKICSDSLIAKNTVRCNYFLLASYMLVLEFSVRKQTFLLTLKF